MTPTKNDQAKLCFVLNFRTKGIHFSNRRFDPAEIDVVIPEVSPSVPVIQIKFRQKIDQQGGGGFNGQGEGSARCEIIASREQCKFVGALNNFRYEPYFNGIPLPLIQHGQERISVDGDIMRGFAIPGQLLPTELLELSKRVEENLKRAVKRIVGLLRWQQDVTSPTNPIDFSGLYWRYLTDIAYYVPRIQDSMMLNMIDHIHWVEENRAELGNLLSNNDMYEPLGQELLREAKDFFELNHSRTAALIAYVALETGTKQFIQSTAPSSSWLIENLQSPPTPRLLRDYIPQIIDPNLLAIEKWKNLKPLFSRLEKLMECRNKIVHFGSIHADKPIPETFLRDVGDILYVLDVLNGHQWAKRHLNQETLVALGWTAERDEKRDGKRGTVIISEGF